MRAFLVRLSLFALPVFLAFVALEVFVRTTPNAFSGKANFLRTHLANVRCLVLGSSHNQCAINPAYLEIPSANIAYSGQDEKMDSLLLASYLPQLPQLEVVLVECDYHSLEEMLGDDYFRYSWYYHFYDVNNGHVPLLQKISLYASEPQFFNDLLKRTFQKNTEGDRFNEYGFVVNDFPGPFLDAKYDSLALENEADERLKLRHRTDSAALAALNANTIRGMIALCESRGVKPLLLASPMYSSYLKRRIPAKVERRAAFLREMQARGILFLDFENDARFNAEDFKNDDHLNPTGAEKFTRILNDTLRSVLSGS